MYAPSALHIPDGFLTPLVASVGWILAGGLVGLALRQTRQQLRERQVPVMGVLAAFIFAAQAINFPVAAGTSGHLIGAALAAILLGPWGGLLVMTAVVSVQALLFQDGGLIVMGWNILNMGALGALSAYGVYRLAMRLVGAHRAGRLAAAFAAAWVSVEVGAMAAAIELAVSGTAALDLALPAMAGVHALIGVGEGIITVGAVGLISSSRPALLDQAEVAPGRSSAYLVIAGLVVALGLALLSPLASGDPDGLNAVAETLGFARLDAAREWAPLAGYRLPGLENPASATMVAVAAGTLIVFGAAVVVGRWLRPRRPAPE
ncbi:MAG TPA: energy-coupling factor ABC transporter permease [Anaerolineales bacterium]|nr:energy-coupling factor ABC transporter permease [Anaerolineales bacterium]